MEWSPDPQIVLLLGIGLIITNLLVKSPTITRTLARFVLPPKEWQKLAQGTPSDINGWSIFGEIVFVVILYIVANISDTLSRAALLFECALYLLLFVFYGPAIIQHITGISGMYSDLTHHGGPEHEPPKPGIK
jgi:intracellular septation protein A